MTSFPGIHSSNSQSINNIPVSNLGQTHFVQCLPPNYSTVSFSPVSQTLNTPVNHIRLIRPGISQPNTGGVVKVINAPSDSPVRIICVMDPNSSKIAPNAMLQSGKPLNINMSQGQNTQNENTNHGLSNNFSQSSEFTYPISTTGAQVLSPQQVASIPSESVSVCM